MASPVSPRQPDPREAREVTAMEALKLCGLCCWTFCPPVPELVTRKLAFHPPKRGITYTLRVKVDIRVEVNSAKQLLNKEFEIDLSPSQFFTPLEAATAMETVAPFVVTTAHKNHLVCVKVSPSNSSASRDMDSPHNQVILFSQPNSSDLGQMLQPAARLLQQMANTTGVEVYAYDYSGYGYSTGTASEKNTYADIRALYDHIRQTRPEKKILLVGFSIGTAVSSHLASQNPPSLAGVVLVAPFTSGLTLLRRTDPDQDCWLDRFRSFERMQLIEAPVLLIHGTEDTVVPVEHTFLLHRKLRQPVPPLILYGADHQTILLFPATNRRIHNFMLFEAVGSERGEESSRSSL